MMMESLDGAKIAEIKKASLLALEQSSLPAEDEKKYLMLFSQLECFDPLIKILKQKIHNDEASLYHYCLYAKTLFLAKPQDPKWLEATSELVRKFKPSFASFAQETLPKIFDEPKAGFLVSVLEDVESSFSSTSERVACLSHAIALIEAHLFDEKRARRNHERVLELDPKNFKSLYFFKNLYVYERNWNQVANYTKLILNLDLALEEKGLFALDLAELTLHHLRDPKTCLELLEKYCEKSNKRDLLQYQSLDALQDYEATITLLKSFLESEKSPSQAAYIHQKIASLYLRLENNPQALEHFFAAHKKFPQFFEPLEEIIQIAVEMDNIELVVTTLKLFSEHCTNPDLQSRISRLVTTLRKE